MIIARILFKRKEQRPSKYNNITDKEFNDYFSYFAFLYAVSKNQCCKLLFVFRSIINYRKHLQYLNQIFKIQIRPSTISKTII